MGDMISRAAAMRAFAGKKGVYYHSSYIVGELNCLPAVDAAPVVHGRWKVILNPFWDAECSECGYKKRNGWEWEFCPNCGAKMDKNREEKQV